MRIFPGEVSRRSIPINQFHITFKGSTMPHSIRISREILNLQLRKFITRRFINIERSLIIPRMTFIPCRNPRKPSLHINSRLQTQIYQLMFQLLHAPGEYHWSRICIVRMKVFASDKFIWINDIPIRHIRLLEIFPAEAENEVRAFRPWKDVRGRQNKEHRHKPRQKQTSCG